LSRIIITEVREKKVLELLRRRPSRSRNDIYDRLANMQVSYRTKIDLSQREQRKKEIIDELLMLMVAYQLR
jgi:hypothetical protein